MPKPPKEARRKPVTDKKPIMGLPLLVMSGNRHGERKLSPVVGFL